MAIGIDQIKDEMKIKLILNMAKYSHENAILGHLCVHNWIFYIKKHEKVSKKESEYKKMFYLCIRRYLKIDDIFILLVNKKRYAYLVT